MQHKPLAQQDHQRPHKRVKVSLSLSILLIPLPPWFLPHQSLQFQALPTIFLNRLHPHRRHQVHSAARPAWWLASGIAWFWSLKLLPYWLEDLLGFLNVWGYLQDEGARVDWLLYVCQGGENVVRGWLVGFLVRGWGIRCLFLQGRVLFHMGLLR